MINYADTKQKKARIAMLMPYKIDFTTRKVEKKGINYIILKKSFLQKDIIFSIHASNNTTLKYVRQKLIKLQGERQIHHCSTKHSSFSNW